MKKLFQGLAKLFSFTVLKLVLIIIGLLIFNISWLVALFYFNVSWQWQLGAAAIVTVIYIIIVLLAFLINYLLEHKVKIKLALPAQGIEQLKSDVTVSQRYAYRRYLFHKFNWSRYLPLALQRLRHAKPIYIVLGQTPSLDSALAAQGWKMLDNPQQFPVHVWTNQRHIIINIPAETSILITDTLKLLARYSYLRRIAGIILTIEAKQLLENAIQPEILLNQLQAVMRFKTFRKTALSVWITGVEKIEGAQDAYKITEISERMVHGFQLSGGLTTLVYKLEGFILRQFQHTVDYLENARLLLFIAGLRRINHSLPLLLNKLQQQLPTMAIWQQGYFANASCLTMPAVPKTTWRERLNNIAFPLQIALLVICIISLGLFIYSYTANQNKLATLKDDLNAYQRQVNISSIADNQSVEKGLFLAGIFQPDTDSWLLHNGLYQGKKVQNIVQPIYQLELQDYFLPQLQQQLATILQQAITTKQSVDQALAAYLMLSEPEHYQADTIINCLNQQQNPVSPLNTTAEKILQRLNSTNFVALKANPLLVQQARALLPPLTTAIQHNLQSMATKMPKLNWQSNLNDPSQLVFTNTATNISTFYTKAAYENYFQKNFSQLVSQIISDNWIYGIANNETSRQQIATILQDQYTQSYITVWETFLDTLTVQPAADFNAALALSNATTQPDAFWLALVKLVVANTHLSDVTVNEPVATAVSQNFSDWNNLLNTANGKQTLMQIQTQFTQIQQDLQKANASGNASQALFLQLQTALQSNSGIPAFNTLNNLLPTLPKAFATRLYNIRQSIANGMFVTAKDYLNTLWQQQILAPNKDALQSYPLQALSQNDMPATQFSALFAPKGMFDQFLQTNIAPFIRIETGEPISLYGAAMTFSSSDERLFQVLTRIKNNFFNQGALQINYSLQPLYLSNDIASSKLNLANQTLLYQHGPQIAVNFSWPLQASDPSAALSWTDKMQHTQTVNVTGEWAWLRLLQQASLSRTAQNNSWRLTFSQNQQQLVLQVTGSPAISLALRGELSSLQFPDSL